MGRIAGLLVLNLLLPGPARANTTRFYFRIQSPTSLSVTITQPTESWPGGACNGSNGCQQITHGETPTVCDGDRKGVRNNPFVTFTVVTTDPMSIDPGPSPNTGFEYYVNSLNPPNFAQPMMQVTYFAYDPPAGNPVRTELMNPPCDGLCSTCPELKNSAIVKINKDGSGVSMLGSSTFPSGALVANLPAGSTILVDVWAADGSGDAGFFSTSLNQSYIQIPYSKDNVKVFGSITPQYILQGAPLSATIVLENTFASAPAIDVFDIVIPGNLPGGNAFTTVFVDAISVAGAVTTATASVTSQASGAGNGLIHVTFSPAIGLGATVYVHLTATAPNAVIQTIKWDGTISGPIRPAMSVVESFPDALYSAVLPPPAMATGLTVVPLNTPGGGQMLQVNWTGPSPAVSQAITGYRIFRGGSPLVTQYGSPQPGWKPTTAYFPTTGGQAYVDTGLINDTVYCYQVQAISPVGATDFTAAVCGTPYADPARPAGLTVLVSSQAAQLTWLPAAGGTYPLSGYQVWRASCATCPLVFSVTQVGATATAFADALLSNSALYLYEVRAFDDRGHLGPFSVSDTGRPAVNPPVSLTVRYDYALAAVSLQWLPSTKNVFPLTAYKIYRATCTTCALGVVSTTWYDAATLFVDSTTAVGKLYFYAASALTTEAGLTEGALTPTARFLTPPAPPTGLTVKAAAGATLFVSWADPNPPAVVSAYNLFVSTQSAAGPFTLQIQNVTGNTSYTHAGYVALPVRGGLLGQRYYYRVSAWFQSGPDYAESPPSSVVSLPIEPSVPTGLTGAAGDTVIHLVWNNLSGTQDVDGYRVYRSSIPGLPGSTILLGSVATPPGMTATVAFDDTLVTNGFTYSYRVIPFNQGGDGPYASTLGLIPFVPPGPPGWLTVTTGLAQLDLTWDAAVPIVFPIAGYEIWRATYAGGEVLLGVPISTTFTTDTGLVNGTTYFYKVRAVDTYGNVGAFGNEATGTPAIPPCPPASSTAHASAAAVDVGWSAVTWGTCAGPAFSLTVAGYGIYRSTVPGQMYSKIGTAPGVTYYADASVTVGTTYYYAIRSFDTASPPNESVQLSFPFNPRYSAPDAVATPRTLAAPPAGLTTFGEPNEHDGRLKLSWIPSVAGTFAVLGYNVYRSTSIGGSETKVYVSGGSADYYFDLNLTNGRFYYYRVAAQEERGFEGDWTAVTGTPFTDPGAPSSLTLLEGDTAVTLGWAAPSATTSTFAVTAYRVYRASFPGTFGLSATVFDWLFATTFTDSGLTNGAAYYYHVKSWDPAGHLSHAFSAEVSGTPWAAAAAPLGLTAIPGGLTVLRITLGWNAATAGTYPVSGYRIYRTTYAGMSCPGPFLLATVTGGAL